MPRPVTPARRGRPGEGDQASSRAIGRRPDGRRGFGGSQATSGGSSPWRRARTTFSTLAMPAAARVWPRLPLIDPSRHSPTTCASACASMASPITVPVPCASTTSTLAGSTPASA
jgi:hypothetical protein